MTNTADIARTARQLPFTVGQQDDLRSPIVEFTAAYQHAVREGVTLCIGQTRTLGYVGYPTAAELFAVDAAIRHASASTATGVAHRRIEADGTVIDVKADGTEAAPRAAILDGLAADLTKLA